MWRRSSSSHVGRAYIPAQDLAGSNEGWLADRWLDILGEGAAAAAQQAEASCPGAVCRRRRRPPMGRRRRRRGAVPHPCVPQTFFKQRQGCRVSLYQDAHVPDAFRPSAIRLAGGRAY